MAGEECATGRAQVLLLACSVQGDEADVGCIIFGLL